MQTQNRTYGLLLGGLAAAALAGCGGGSDVRTFDEHVDVTHTEEHEHHAHGPHGGHVVELGGEDYHAEITLGADRKLTVYLLAADLKTPLPVDAQTLSVRLQVEGAAQEFSLTAAPPPAAGDGKSSEFTLTEGELPEAIHDAEDLEGEIVVMIAGTQYRGPITHDHDHDHEGHDHGHEGEAHAH